MNLNDLSNKKNNNSDSNSNFKKRQQQNKWRMKWKDEIKEKKREKEREKNGNKCWRYVSSAWMREMPRYVEKCLKWPRFLGEFDMWKASSLYFTPWTSDVKRMLLLDQRRYFFANFSGVPNHGVLSFIIRRDHSKKLIRTGSQINFIIEKKMVK